MQEDSPGTTPVQCQVLFFGVEDGQWNETISHRTLQSSEQINGVYTKKILHEKELNLE
jgi:hypothetical protein